MLRKRFTKDKIEAGCDEAGRGCLAGPVVAAAVILPPRFRHPLLNDSKQLNVDQRNLLRKVIEAKATAYAVAFVDNEEIDKINILNASFLAMHRALDQLKISPELLLIDGNRFNPYRDFPFECIIGGDGRFASIAAASILAKTYRDEYMHQLAAQHPLYSWETNVGYPTVAHREAIKCYGTTTYHRRSFKLLPEQLELFTEEITEKADL